MATVIIGRACTRCVGRRSSRLAKLQRVIASIPRGKVITYGQVAAAGGSPGAARLTVWALHGGRALPWHRVVGAGGRISLPGEEGLEQRVRLQIEGVTFRRGKVRMELHGWDPAGGRTERRRKEAAVQRTSRTGLAPEGAPRTRSTAGRHSRMPP